MSLSNKAEDILADLDCSLERTELILPTIAVPSEQLDFLRNYIQENLRLTTPIIAPVLSGAVTSGDLWKFGTFHHQDRKVFEDRNLYQVLRDLETIFQMLVALAQGYYREV